MIDLAKYLKIHGITPKGVLHVGAHIGEEVPIYIQLGFSKIVLIEANPSLCNTLNSKFIDDTRIRVIHSAITDFNGEIDLRLTSFDQSSSILELKHHKIIYPNISEIGVVRVPARTLDHCLLEQKIRSDDFNFLSMDIQGAELLALRGSTQTLHHIELINIEVSTEELYKDSATFEDIERFLRSMGFNRIVTSNIYHPSWGDALYIRKPAISMETLGKNGRFGNQIFQYFFLRVMSHVHDTIVQTPQWLGSSLFGLDDGTPIIPSPRVYQSASKHPETMNMVQLDPEHLLSDSIKLPTATDLWGYFQLHTSQYNRFKELWRRTFTFRQDFEQLRLDMVGPLKSLGKQIIGIHLRRGDFGYGPFYKAPVQWYIDCIYKNNYRPDTHIIYIASEEQEAYLGRFSHFDVISSKSLRVQQTPLAVMIADFLILTSVDILCISNSTFSFAASLLNNHAQKFMRPSYGNQGLIEFNPWNSEILEHVNLSEGDHLLLSRLD